ncbi:MAG TPA: ParB/RepB/Spo0J family partition protein [bacterium]|nr:ParB/RepB/Spo0J family partition protein [bacterium]
MTTNHPPRKPALGRGLGALIAPTATAAVAAPAAAARPQGLQQIPLAKIDVNPYQPRKQFGEEALRELADSISRHGLLAPLVVRPKGDTFELIAGERRFRALKLLERPEALAFVRNADDTASMALAITENIQREELNPLEIAYAYQMLADEGLTHQDIAARVGKSRAGVSNQIRLLKLPEAVRMALRSGQLEMGHARALVAIEDETRMAELAQKVMERGLTVRQTEELVAGRKAARAAAARKIRKVDANIRDLEEKFSHALKTAVTIKGGTRGGKVVIAFRSLADFDRIFASLTTHGSDADLL